MAVYVVKRVVENDGVIAINGTSVQDKAFTGVIGLFTDNDPSDSSYTAGNYSASIDWGDGTTSAGTITSIRSNFS